MYHSSHHHAHELFVRFVVSLTLTLLVLIVPYVLPVSFSGPLVVLASSIVVIYGGIPFYKGMVTELRAGKPGMMTLVGVALIVAYSYSLMVSFGIEGTSFYNELTTLVVIMLLGHWLEMRSVLGTSRAVEALSELLPSVAHQVSNGATTDIAIAAVKKGMTILIKPGEQVSADGVVLSGTSDVNEAALTGEFTLVEKKKGDTVIAGSLNGNGSLTITVTKDQEQNYIAQVIALVGEVLESKSGAQDIADRAAFILTLIALSLGLVAGLFWYGAMGMSSYALERFVTILVTACPHALGLAVPLVIVVITGKAAEKGLLIRNRRAFEKARLVTAVVFDKTGTLTEGKFMVTDVLSFGSLSKEEIIALAASSEPFGKHALAQALKKKAQQEEIMVPVAEEGRTIPGKGVQSVLDGEQLFVGNMALLDDAGIDYQETQEQAQELRSQGKTLVYVARHRTLVGLIAFTDTIRPEAKQAVRELLALGKQVIMITGDTEQNARVVAHELGIQQVYAGVLPNEKAQLIEQFREDGQRVAMVGDGINDAPALAAAEVGIAIGAGTDVALETADIILVQNNPLQVLDILNLSDVTARKINQNILWATGYNVIALPLAAGILEPFGISVSPAIGALLMSLSTVIVALNARYIKF